MTANRRFFPHPYLVWGLTAAVILLSILAPGLFG